MINIDSYVVEVKQPPAATFTRFRITFVPVIGITAGIHDF